MSNLNFTISEAKKQIILAYRVGNPTFVWGKSGIGKSAMIDQTIVELADIYGLVANTPKTPAPEGTDPSQFFGEVDMRLSQRNELDLRGVPFTVKGADGMTYTCYANPDELPRVDRDGPRGILLLEECNSGQPAVQAGAYQLVHDGQLGEYIVPDGWFVLAAGNYASDNGITYQLAAPLENRFFHLHIEVSVQELIDWGHKTGLLDPIVCAYLGHRPDYVHDYDADRESSAWASPRTWEMLSRILPLIETETPLIQQKVIAGYVGAHVAADYAGFSKRLDSLVDVEKVINDPDNADVPTDPNSLWALNAALTMVVASRNKPKPDAMDAIVTYSKRLPRSYGMALVHAIIHRSEECDETSAATVWKAENAHHV